MALMIVKSKLELQNIKQKLRHWQRKSEIKKTQTHFSLLFLPGGVEESLPLPLLPLPSEAQTAKSSRRSGRTPRDRPGKAR